MNQEKKDSQHNSQAEIPSEAENKSFLVNKQNLHLNPKFISNNKNKYENSNFTFKNNNYKKLAISGLITPLKKHSKMKKFSKSFTTNKKNKNEIIFDKNKRRIHSIELRKQYGKKMWRKNYFFIIFYVILFSKKMKKNISGIKLQKLRRKHYNIIKDKSFFLIDNFERYHNKLIRNDSVKKKMSFIIKFIFSNFFYK